MLSNGHNSLNKKTFTFPTHINKKAPNRTNTRYENVQNKSSAPIAYNIQNNQFFYKSENKKGYNQMKIPSFSKNNDILLINPNTYTTVSKGKVTSPNSLNWNNIGFKEIKCKNTFTTSNYKSNLLEKNNNLLSSYNLSNNYGAMAKNLGFYDINSNQNSKKYSKYNNNNLLYSKKTGLKSSYGSTLTNSNNSINNLNRNSKQKDSLVDYYKKITQIKNAREGLNSKVIKDRMNNEDNIKKINKIQAVWKGIYVRELMSYYWNFYHFQKLLEKFFNNKYKKKFLMNLKKKDLIGDLNKKKREYNNLKNEYDKILKQLNEFKKNNEKNKKQKIKFKIEKKNQFNILQNEKINSNQKIEEEIPKLKSLNKKKDTLKIINNDNIIYEKVKNENIYEKNHSSFAIICHISKENKETEPIEKENNKIFMIESQKGFNYENKKLFDIQDLSVDKNNDLNIFGYKPNKENKVKENNFFINERFPIVGQIKAENKQENENKELLLLISNQNNIMIKKEEKNRCDKTTETTKEHINNLIKPNKNSELLFKGIKKLNKDKKEQIFKKENNFIEIKKKENVPVFIKENNSIEIKKKENVPVFIKENNFIEFKPINIDKKVVNYNLINEIEKGDALEINPYEIKRTKISNKISPQNNIEVFASYNLFTEKSKNNLTKIIFPIRLKKVFIQYMKKIYFPELINQLRKISLLYALIQIKKKYETKMKKISLKKLKEKAMLLKLRKYFKVEMDKYEIKKMIRKYVYKKWNQGLLDLSKIIINNKK